MDAGSRHCFCCGGDCFLLCLRYIILQEGFMDRRHAYIVQVLAVLVIICISPSLVSALPAGSYQQSCKNCTDDDATVRCDCSYKSKYTATALDYKICDGDIWNDKSKLRCTPKGSFKRSCSSISWNSSFLTAKCNKKKSGTIWNSGFNYNNCLTNGQDIANCDGSLTCGSCP
jgi:hypothetical protein